MDDWFAASMKGLFRTVSIVLIFYSAAACTKRIDCTESEGFAPIVGCCLVTTHDMLAVNSDENTSWLIPNVDESVSGRAQRGHRVVPKGATVVIDEIEYLESFDGYFLFIGATLELPSGERMNVYLDDLVDHRWMREARRAMKNGLCVDIDENNLPFLWEHLDRCTVEPEPGETL